MYIFLLVSLMLSRRTNHKPIGRHFKDVGAKFEMQMLFKLIIHSGFHSVIPDLLREDK